MVGRHLRLALGWCCLGGSWTCSVWGRGSLLWWRTLCPVKRTSLTVLVAEERDEPFRVEQEWVVCFSGYHQGQLEKRIAVCLSKPRKIPRTRSTRLTPIHSKKQNLRAQKACAYMGARRVHTHRAHAKSTCTGLAPLFVQH